MARTVWKFPLSWAAYQEIEMPEQARVVLVGMQGDTPTVWAECDTEATDEKRGFYVRGTGEVIRDGPAHVGSFQQGPLVWHVFEHESG